jgi:two-component system, NarL family, nitrate/nitrite response regulator NarL
VTPELTLAARPRERPAVVPIRVLIADRQPLFRDAIARAIRQRVGFKLVAEVADGRDALLAIESEEPDVAVVDRGLPGLDGARILNAVVRDELPTRVLFLATARDAGGVYDALAAGAAGWLSKLADERDLCAAIVAVAGGGIALSADVQTALAGEIRRRATAPRPLLDDRERRVLVLVGRGYSASEIGRELHLSTGAVKTSLLKVYKRLGVSERAAAVAVALRRGLID